jgi:site-specific DNA-methyltransferase (cytosine-N4-specific)
MRGFTTILEGKADVALSNWPAGSVQTCITSPPYFNLRDYGHVDQIGNEETPQEYVAEIVKVMEAVRRVLRDDGTLWFNIGDTYGKTNVSKDKDLIGIPWMVATALRDAGWYLRNDIIWHKPNPMTEGAHDRITRAHEHLFLFSKSKDYYFDDVAIMEPTSDGLGMRQKRDVWTIPVARYKGAHFAVFPEALVEPCVLAGTSEKGQCLVCGLPAGRSVSRTRTPTRPGLLTKATGNGSKEGNRDPGRHVSVVETTGWTFDCQCLPSQAVAQFVLDPFFGSGTTGVVANRLGRNCLGVEVNPAYIPMANARLAEAAHEEANKERRLRNGRRRAAARLMGIAPVGGDSRAG